MIKGSSVPKVNMMNKIADEVTRERTQLFVKAMISAEIRVALYSTSTPSFSLIPSWRVLLEEVMVDVAKPEGMESKT